MLGLGGSFKLLWYIYIYSTHCIYIHIHTKNSNNTTAWSFWGDLLIRMYEVWVWYFFMTPQDEETAKDVGVLISLIGTLLNSVFGAEFDCRCPASPPEGWFRLKVWSRRFIAMFWRVVKIEGRLSSMLRINVALLNGKPELVTLLPSCTVQDVRDRGPTSLWEKAPQTYHCEESSPSGSW